MSLDPRLRSELHREAERIDPDVEQNLTRVLGRSRRGSAGLGSLALVAAAVIAVVLFLRFQMDSRPGPGIEPSGLHPSPVTDESVAGSWTVTLGDEPGVASQGLGGTWVMRLEPNGSIELVAPATFHPPSGAVSPGAVYVIQDGTFVTSLLARDFSATCAGSGTYGWSLSEAELTFAFDQDTCEPRRTLLTSRPWTSSPSP